MRLRIISAVCGNEEDFLCRLSFVSFRLCCTSARPMVNRVISIHGSAHSKQRHTCASVCVCWHVRAMHKSYIDVYQHVYERFDGLHLVSSIVCCCCCSCDWYIFDCVSIKSLLARFCAFKFQIRWITHRKYIEFWHWRQHGQNRSHAHTHTHTLHELIKLPIVQNHCKL